MKKLFSYLIFFLFFTSNLSAKDNTMIMKLKYGEVEISLFEDIAPNHVKRFKELANSGKYDNVVFHRVIDGFMAQTGDVKYGNSGDKNFNLSLAGTGGSDLPNVDAEFSNTPHVRGVLSAARSSNPNSFNSQFFICFDDAPHLDRQYTAFGKSNQDVEFIDKIKRATVQMVLFLTQIKS